MEIANRLLKLTNTASTRKTLQIPSPRSQNLLMKVSIAAFIFIGLLTTNTQNVIAESGTAPLHIVVLGSSTAAGVGPTNPAHAWVNRYRSFWLERNPQSQVTNLAKGGYNTYHIKPTGSTPPPSRPSPDPDRNITKALSLNPDAIIINLPSNDAASGYTVTEQLANYDDVLAAANAQNVPVWISTTQPRDLTLAGRLNLKAMRDSTLARYGNKALNFWAGIATEIGTIRPQYDSGDGVHLNGAGHAILFRRAGRATFEFLYSAPAHEEIARANSVVQLHANYPNPSNPTTIIPYSIQTPGLIEIAIYNILGQKVKTLVDGHIPAGQHNVLWDGKNESGLPVSSGIYLYQIEALNFKQARQLQLIR